MGNLTKSMTMLREEIGTLRQARVKLRQALMRETIVRRDAVSGMCAAFARDRADARRAWLGLNARPATPPIRTTPSAAPLPHAPERTKVAAPQPAAPPPKTAPFVVAPPPAPKAMSAAAPQPVAPPVKTSPFAPTPPPVPKVAPIEKPQPPAPAPKHGGKEHKKH